VFHLFRLPSYIESGIYDALAGDGIRNLSGVIGARDDALRMLGDLAGAERIQSAVGPVNCGHVGSLQRRRGLQRLCAAYLGAFQSGVAAFPYLEPDGQ
jgi:hypothetical protein